MEVCVIGAGVIGLSVVERLLSTVKGVKVTVMADAFSPNTTSDVAGGFWQPYMMEDTSVENIRKWGSETFQHLQRIALSSDAEKAGVFLASGYDIFKEPFEKPFWSDIVVDFKEMEAEELQQFPGHSHGYAWTSLIAEGKKYLVWLMEKCKFLGAVFVKRRIKNFEELAGYDVIVNCTGLGSRQLADDSQLLPVKGQLIRVKAPWIKHFLNADDEDLYMLPGTENIVLGGTHVKHDWSTDANPRESERIWQGLCKLVPTLHQAEKLDEVVGLRPARTVLRLEKQILNSDKGSLKIVHNYGHGGGGVTLHWGCAGEAVRLVLEMLPQPKHRL